MEVTQKTLGIVDEKEMVEFILKNERGLSVSALNFGCIITKIETPDRNGKVQNVVLGFDSVEEYVKNPPYFGAVVGRVAGRIKGAEFFLDGQSYHLDKNDGNNHLHGGTSGWSKVVWEAAAFSKSDVCGVCFTYKSSDGEGGYPGNVNARVTYTLNNHNEFTIQYEADTDQTTLINMTNHTYFNLSGDLERDVLGHVLKMDSDQFLELNDELLPTGDYIDVSGTAFDFTSGRKITEGAESNHPQNLLAGGGYDHPFLLNGGKIRLEDEESGRVVEILTDAPSVVLYTGNQLGEDLLVYGGKARKYLGLCLETQGLPDAIHHPSFPSIVVKKDQPFTSKTTFTFFTE